MTDNPLNVVVTESALPYVALVLYAAQQVEGEQPAFARQLVEAARYFEGLMLPKTCATCQHWRGINLCIQPDMVAAGFASVFFHAPSDTFSCCFHALRDAADRREPRRP